MKKKEKSACTQLIKSMVYSMLYRNSTPTISNAFMHSDQHINFVFSDDCLVAGPLLLEPEEFI